MKRMFTIFVLLICSALMAVAQEVYATSSADTKTATKTTTKSSGTGIDLSALDKSVDPCVDFYQYSCGNWRKTHPIPADKGSYGRFVELIDRNQEVLKNLLEKASDSNSTRTPIEAKVGDYYAACMDTKTVEAKGASPLQPWLERINNLKTRADVIATAGELRKHGVNALFSFYPSPDLKDSTITLANVDQGGITLPDRDYYLKTDAKSVEVRAKYVEHVQKMFELLGDKPEAAAAEAKSIMALETEWAKASMDRVARRDPKNRDHKMTHEALLQLAPNFDFDTYLKAVDSPSFTQLNVGNPDFFKQLNDKIASTSVDDLKTYLRWRVLNSTAQLLSSPFVDETFRFGGQYMRGAKELEVRWKRCARFTDGDLGEALGQLYVEKTFGADGKARMKNMVDALTEALRDDIKGLSWMTDPTKKRALEKLEAFNRNKVGYPDKWRDYSSVKIARDDFFGNSRRADDFEVKRRDSKIGKPVDKTEWGMTPPTVNAYYNGSFNEIVFPAGILQPPFFNRDADDAVNFGGIGVVIGHEFTHGFDDQGRKFDPKGNLNDWWTEADANAFKERAKCVSDEYSGFTSVKDPKNGDVHLNGDLTLGENTADNGGARIAYNALEETLEHKRKKSIDGFTPEQRFFLGFANIWCQNTSEQDARLRAQTDPHSPGEFRVNGTVSNMPEFQKAFGCKAGQPMVRENACRVW